MNLIVASPSTIKQLKTTTKRIMQLEQPKPIPIAAYARSQPGSTHQQNFVPYWWHIRQDVRNPSHTYENCITRSKTRNYDTRPAPYKKIRYHNNGDNKHAPKRNVRANRA